MEKLKTKGDPLVNLWYKEGHATMHVAKIPRLAAQSIILNVDTICKNHGVKTTGNFIITK